MANASRATGLSPVKHFNGSNWNGQATMYVILSDNTDPFGVGTPVKSFAGGDANGVPAVALAAAGDTLRGVIVGIIPAQQTDPVGPVPATKTRNYYVLVVDDPTVIFEAQVNNTGSFPTTDLNKNANFVVVAPSGISPFAGTYVGYSTINTTQGLQLKIQGVVQRADVDLSANTKLLVSINQHELMGNTAGL